MTNPIILVGGGGHCKACIDVIEAEGKYSIEGILDTEDKVGAFVLNYSVIGTDGRIDEYIRQGYHFLITVGQIKSSSLRERLFYILKSKNARLATIVSPTAYVSSHAILGEGTIVMHYSVINAGAAIGDNCIINTASLVEHDSIVGDNVHISTKATINGEVKIGSHVFIGSSSVVAQSVCISDDVIIGAGSVVIRNINTPGTYAGNPIRVLNEK